MTWRVHLPHPVIRRIDLLTSERTVVAVWTQGDRVHFYDQRNGSSLGERVVEKLAFSDRQDERWRAFLAGLKAPNGIFLPMVRAQGLLLYITEDGRTRLLEGEGRWIIELAGKESPLSVEQDTKLLALDMDRQSGTIAGLDSRGKLHLFEGPLYAGVYDTTLMVEDGQTLNILVADSGKLILLSDGQSLMMMESTGRIRKRLELHYPLGAVAISPDGKWIATSDAEVGVIRLYDGTTLAPTFQRFAIDLAADARRLNAGAGNQPTTVTTSVLGLTNRGVLAFALGALLCVTSTSRMRPLPAVQT